MSLQERNQRIVSLWEQGRTSGEIATLLGVTRSSVMGVVHRARRDGYVIARAPRIKPEPEKVTRMPKKPPLTAVTPPPMKVGSPSDAEVAAAARAMAQPPAKRNNKPKTIMQLGHFDCRWILPNNLYCGETAKSAQTPWCEEHYQLVYVPRSKGRVSPPGGFRL